MVKRFFKGIQKIYSVPDMNTILKLQVALCNYVRSLGITEREFTGPCSYLSAMYVLHKLADIEIGEKLAKIVWEALGENPNGAYSQDMIETYINYNLQIVFCDDLNNFHQFINDIPEDEIGIFSIHFFECGTNHSTILDPTINKTNFNVFYDGYLNPKEYRIYNVCRIKKNSRTYSELERKLSIVNSIEKYHEIDNKLLFIDSRKKKLNKDPRIFIFGNFVKFFTGFYYILIHFFLKK